MNKIITIVFAAVLACATTENATAQKFPGLDKSPMDAASYPANWKDANKMVKVVYSRPQLKGREITKLAPYNKVWRTGANEAAEITFYTDVEFGGKLVEEGTYTLFTIPKKDDWTVILSTQRNVWGSYFYDKNKDVVRVTGKRNTTDNALEAFSMIFLKDNLNPDKVVFYMGWGNTLITVPITEATTAEDDLEEKDK